MKTVVATGIPSKKEAELVWYHHRFQARPNRIYTMKRYKTDDNKYAWRVLEEPIFPPSEYNNAVVSALFDRVFS